MRTERAVDAPAAPPTTSTRPALGATGGSGPGAAAAGAERARREPSDWLVIGLGLAYVVALAALIFLPGGTLIERLRALDGGICAQAPSHSFFPAGQQLPLCARNTGIYVGFACTLLTLLAVGRLRAARLPVTPLAVVLGIVVAVMAVDGFNSLLLDLHLPHLYQPHNLLRLATGLGTGTAMAAFLLPVANGLTWHEDDTRSSFATFGQLGVMLPVLALAFLAIASQAAWLLYPLAVLGSAGLVTALTLVNLVFVLGLRGGIGQMTTYRQVFPVFSLTAALAIIELMALFALKSAALHTLAR